MDDIIIRPATEEDVAPIAALHVASWRDAYAQIFTPEFLSGGIEADRLAVWSQRLRDRPATQLVNVACDFDRAHAGVCLRLLRFRSRLGKSHRQSSRSPAGSRSGNRRAASSRRLRSTFGKSFQLRAAPVGLRGERSRPSILRTAWRPCRRERQLQQSGCRRKGCAARALANPRAGRLNWGCQARDLQPLRPLAVAEWRSRRHSVVNGARRSERAAKSCE